MNQKDELEFDIEDILREFGSHPEPDPTPEPAVPVPEEEEEVTGDTIRLDKVREAVNAGQDADGTRPFTPVRIGEEEEEAPSPPVPESQEPVVEPFSEGWEPEYDDPIDDFSAPDPIPFRPQPRLRELREKLISGPERQYYALSEVGVGKLQAGIFLCLLVFLVSAGSTALHALGLVGTDRLRLLVFLQFFCLLLSGLLGCYRLMEGLADLFRLRFTGNTLLSCTFIACCVDGLLCLKDLRISTSAAFCLEMVLALWATYDRRSAQLGMTDTLRRATSLEGVSLAEDWSQGRPAYITTQGRIEDFMDGYQAPSAAQKVLDRYALAVLIASVAIGILGGARHGIGTGIQVWTAAMLMGLPAAAFLATPRPMAVLEKRLHKLGTALCGWEAVDRAKKSALFPLTDEDLFPQGCAKLTGVKFFGDRSADMVVAYATALVRQGGGPLKTLFGRLLESRGGRSFPIEELRTYDGGIGGMIGADPLLVGSLRFMQDMGVDMSEGIRVEQAVYCAIDGELCGVFAVTYQRSRTSAMGLRSLCSRRKLTPVVLCEDFLVDESVLGAKFKVDTRRMLFPQQKERQELLGREAPEDAQPIALVAKPGLAAKAQAVTGALALKGAAKAGAGIAITGGVVGLLIMAALAWVGGVGYLTPVNILLYQLIWLVPGLLVTEWTRHI